MRRYSYDELCEDVYRKSLEDEAFRKRLLQNPKEEISKLLGVKLPGELKLSVHENTPDTFHLVVPLDPKKLAPNERLGIPTYQKIFMGESFDLSSRVTVVKVPKDQRTPIQS